MKVLYKLLVLLSLPFILYSVVRKQRAECDESNRINKIRLIWFGLTRQNLFTMFVYYDCSTFIGRIRLGWEVIMHEERFVALFPWLTQDEFKNLH